MTFNWGHKVTLGFVAFAGMIVYMVVQSMNTRYDLVSKEYYKDELLYQQVIDGTSRANQLGSRAVITQVNGQLLIQLPREMQHKNITGSVWLYNATDAQKDRKITLEVNEQAIQTIDNRGMIPGSYTAKIRWQANGESYYTEVPVTIQ
jgi:hypothetical protein